MIISYVVQTIHKVVVHQQVLIIQIKTTAQNLIINTGTLTIMCVYYIHTYACAHIGLAVLIN